MNFDEAKRAINGMLTWQRALTHMGEVLDAAVVAQRTVQDAAKHLEELKASIPDLENQKKALVFERDNLQAKYDELRARAEEVLEKELARKKAGLEAEFEKTKAELAEQVDALETSIVKLQDEEEEANQLSKAANAAAAKAEKRLADAKSAYDEFKTKLK